MGEAKAIAATFCLLAVLIALALLALPLWLIMPKDAFHRELDPRW